MLSPSATNTAVDLSRLPSPEVVETLSYQTIFDAMLADLMARDIGFTALVPSDPAWRVLEVAAYRELLIRQRINDAARGVMVAYAVGGALDHLGALVNVARLELTPANPDIGALAVMEDDAAYRRRIVLGPDGFSVAGPEAAYVYHALSAHPDVLDASATSPHPGEVVVTILSRDDDGAADPEVIAAVDARLNAEEIRPLTDQVTVQPAEILDYSVQAQLYVFPGPDSQVVREAALTRLDAYIESSRRLGRDITLSALYAALHAEGVQRVVLAQPLADLVVARTQVAVCTQVEVSVVGDGE